MTAPLITQGKSGAGVASEAAEVKTADVGGFAVAEQSAFAAVLGIDLSGTVEERANLAAEHMNRSQRHMLASGLLLSSIKAESDHGEFLRLIRDRGFEERSAEKAMQYARFIFAQPESVRHRLIEMQRSKVMEIAAADPEVIQVLLEDGGEGIDGLSVRALRERVRSLNANLTNTEVKLDTVTAERDTAIAKLSRQPGDRDDHVPAGDHPTPTDASSAGCGWPAANCCSPTHPATPATT